MTPVPSYDLGIHLQPKKPRYAVLVGFFQEELERDVNEALQQGAALQGGVSVRSDSDGDSVFYQAVVYQDPATPATPGPDLIP